MRPLVHSIYTSMIWLCVQAELTVIPCESSSQEWFDGSKDSGNMRKTPIRVEAARTSIRYQPPSCSGTDRAIRKRVAMMVLVAWTSLLAACGGDSGSADNGGDNAPANLRYASPLQAAVNMPLTPVTPSVTGTVSSYSVSPALPAGLTINTATGTISGTPTATAEQSTYTITASNVSGSVAFGLVLTVHVAPPGGLAYMSPATLTVGQSLSLTPTVTGAVASYSVSPALPAGLALNTTSGLISGVPTAAAAQTTYTVTASNVSGSVAFGLTLGVNPAPPSDFLYSSPRTGVVGQAISLAPAITGTVSSYTVSPALPAGITINAATGIISGTPTAAAAQATYTITAANVSGSVMFALVLTINPAPPTGLSYASPRTGAVGQPLSLSPAVSGTVSSYSVSPALPAGLALNAATGVISGTPTATSAQATYTITAVNVSGSATFGLVLTINVAPPTGLSYSSPTTATIGQALNLAPTVTGAVTNYSASPALPAGLSLNALSGVISGTPAAAAAQATYTITAVNVSGSTSFALVLTVVALPAPSSLLYVPNSVTLPVGSEMTPLAPVINGTVTSWTVSPALPKGLALSSAGVISGIPRESRSASDYVVSAANGSGQANFTLNLAVTTSMPAPSAVVYQTFQGSTVTLYAWEGRNLSVLSRNPALNAGLMQLWLEALDKGWDFYKLATGRSPSLLNQYHGKATIADVGATCGAGCGYLGSTGIEAQSTYFDSLYNSALNNGNFGGFLFYEMGRNFWFYSPEVGYKTPILDAPIVTGYAVLMQWWSMEHAGVQVPGDGCFATSAAALAHIQGVFDTYLQNASLNWANTLGNNAGVAASGCAIDAPVLFASTLMRVRRDYGGTNFHLNLWKEVDARPNATTTQGAIDNLVLAASAASGKNLAEQFNGPWRWPVSAAARAEAQSRWGNPP